MRPFLIEKAALLELFDLSISVFYELTERMSRAKQGVAWGVFDGETELPRRFYMKLALCLTAEDVEAVYTQIFPHEFCCYMFGNTSRLYCAEYAEEIAKVDPIHWGKICEARSVKELLSTLPEFQ